MAWMLFTFTTGKVEGGVVKMTPAFRQELLIGQSTVFGITTTTTMFCALIFCL